MPPRELFGLSQKTIEKIHSVLVKHPEIERVVVYGSRAMGNYMPGSDIDLTFFGSDLDLSKLMKIEIELDDLLLPYKMDISLHVQIEDAELLDHINRVGKIFYEKGVSSSTPI